MTQEGEILASSLPERRQKNDALSFNIYPEEKALWRWRRTERKSGAGWEWLGKETIVLRPPKGSQHEAMAVRKKKIGYYQVGPYPAPRYHTEGGKGNYPEKRNRRLVCRDLSM